MVNCTPVTAMLSPGWAVEFALAIVGAIDGKVLTAIGGAKTLKPDGNDGSDAGTEYANVGNTAGGATENAALAAITAAGAADETEGLVSTMVTPTVQVPTSSGTNLMRGTLATPLLASAYELPFPSVTLH